VFAVAFSSPDRFEDRKPARSIAAAPGCGQQPQRLLVKLPETSR
jgi:hypothetical protein